MSVSDSVLFEGEERTVSGSAPVAQDMEISAGTALTIPAGNSLTILDDVTLTNNGTLTINGPLVNNGILTGSGSIIYKVIGGSLNKTGTSLYVGDELTLTVTPNEGYGWRRSPLQTAAGKWTLPQAVMAPTPSNSPMDGSPSP